MNASNNQNHGNQQTDFTSQKEFNNGLPSILGKRDNKYNAEDI
jgi:hypothetical protein